VARFGPGNFDEDAAANYAAEFVEVHFIQPINDAVRNPQSLERDEWFGVVVPCMVEILAAIAKVRRGLLPDPEVIQGWKAAYLAVWDREGSWPERRAVLVSTFDRLIRLARRERDEATE
jgi:hypothetical protein